MSPTDAIQQTLRFFLVPLSSAASRLGRHFYLALAVLLAAAAAFVLQSTLGHGMQNKAYDLIMKYRLRAPPADPHIVILDIDEPALAAMAGKYGRWPWPRQIIGETIEALEAQKPRAIVFNITFAYADVFNAASDLALREVAARHSNVYFPIFYTGDAAESQKELQLDEIPGATRLDPDAPGEATLPAVVPYFFDAIREPRVGSNNLVTDDDGILRRYAVYGVEYSWRINSLSAAVVAGLGIALPEREDVLINWRSLKHSYRRVSFHDLYFDLKQSARKRPTDEFAGKIVVVGSSAPAMFDFKATPVSRNHSGLDILAVAIDNLKNGDSLTTLPPLVSILVTMLSLALLAVAFVYNVDTRLVNLLFTVVQASFLAVSYLVLNFSTVFVDLTLPFAFSLAYFTVAKAYGTMLNFRRSGHPLFSTMLEPGNACRVFLVQADVCARSPNGRLRLIGDLKKQFGESHLCVSTPLLHRGIPLLQAFFRDTRLFYWLVPESQTREALADVLACLERGLRSVDKAGRGYLRRESRLASFRLHSATVSVDEQGGWREHGAAALAGLYAAMPTAATGETRALAILVSDEFMRSCREWPELAMPPRLVEAGLGHAVAGN
ncbi:MAG: CHASE2 domain-containing protein [Betaproteobacteria bacterium]|nr:CHASE2 domain-containing protein [Betaproteobacteria bacterium]